MIAAIGRNGCHKSECRNQHARKGEGFEAVVDQARPEIGKNRDPAKDEEDDLFEIESARQKCQANGEQAEARMGSHQPGQDRAQRHASVKRFDGQEIKEVESDDHDPCSHQPGGKGDPQHKGKAQGKCQEQAEAWAHEGGKNRLGLGFVGQARHGKGAL